MPKIHLSNNIIYFVHMKILFIKIWIFHYRCLPHEAVKYCISACFFAILWGQNHLMEAADSGNRGEDECRQLKERLHSFMGSMRYFVSGDVNGAVIILFLYFF